MAYDSAGETAKAGQAWQSALNSIAQRRAALNTGFGLNADGSMNNTEAGHLGSIYQGNLGSVQNDLQAQKMDRRRGFSNTRSGMGHQAQGAAEDAGSNLQARMFADANAQLGANTQEKNAADQQYENDKTNIQHNAAWDLANTVVDNPVTADVPGGTALTQFAAGGLISTAAAKARAAAIKANPRAAQAAKNNRL
jgi:hypothetical protein